MYEWQNIGLSSFTLKKENHYALMNAYTIISCIHNNKACLSVNIAKAISSILSGMFIAVKSDSGGNRMVCKLSCFEVILDDNIYLSEVV